jgi:hypothetical protein
MVCVPLCRVMLPGGQDVTMGKHDAGVRCLEWLSSRGLLVTGSWDQVDSEAQRLCNDSITKWSMALWVQVLLEGRQRMQRQYACGKVGLSLAANF